MRRYWMAAALALGLAATPALARDSAGGGSLDGGTLASERFDGARALDGLPAAFTRHTREHRHWEIQRNLERQERRRHRYRDGYGYRRHHGGPPPWAPAHGRRHHERHGRW